jgi:sulfane dehydrogenase subunit SoxC
MSENGNQTGKKSAASRRQFLKAGLAGGAALAATATARASGESAITEIQDWNRYLGDGVDAAPYGSPSEFEAHVVRRDVPWLTADPVSSVNFTPLHELDGIITPNGLCFERHHGGTAIIDPAEHRLMINGLVDTPLVFTMQDLMRFPRENRVYFLECAANSGMEWRGSQLNGCQFTHGMVHCVVYTGVPLRYLLEEAGVKTNGKWLLAEGADASAMTRSIPIEKALDDCLVAFKMNGEALRPEQGYPVRLVVPGWEGNMWVKWLRRLEVGDEPWAQREETSKYTDLLAMDSPPPHLGHGCEVGHHEPEPAGADNPWARSDRDQRSCLVRQWQDQPCRCFDRRRPQLAGGAARRAEPVEGDASLLPGHQLGRIGIAAAVSRDRRDRHDTADQERVARCPGPELYLSQ